MPLRHGPFLLMLALHCCLGQTNRAVATGTTVEARFLLVPGEYVVGVPVYVEFVLRNVSSVPLQIAASEEQGGHFAFKATDAEGNDVPAPTFESSDVGMVSPEPRVVIQPNHELRIRELVNRFVNFGKPGKYFLRCYARINLLGAGLQHGGPVPPYVQSEETLDIEIKPFEEAKVRTVAAKLFRSTESADDVAAARAADALGYVSPDIALPLLANTMQHRVSAVRLAALRAAMRCDGNQAVACLTRALGDEDPYIRSTAARALGKIAVGSPEAAEAVSVLLVDKEWGVRWAAVQALDSIGDKKALRGLRPLLRDPESWVREAARTALSRHGELGESPANKTRARTPGTPNWGHGGQGPWWQPTMPFVIVGAVIVSGLLLMVIKRRRGTQKSRDAQGTFPDRRS